MNNPSPIFSLPGMKRVGAGEWAGPCPRCGGRDRFRAWDAGQGGKPRFWCRGCGWKGDDVDLLRESGLRYREAVAALGRAGAKPVPSPARKSKPAAPSFDRAAARRFVLEHAGPSDYSRARGLTDELCALQKVGWHPQGRKVPGLGFVPAGLVLPTWRGDEVAAVKLRCVPDWNGRRFFQYGDPSPWPLALEPGKPVCIVESEIDALLLVQSCRDMAGVVALRSATNKPGPELMERIKAAPVVLVALDFDAAGGAAATRWLSLPNAQFEPPLVGKDIGDMVAAGVDLREWLALCIPCDAPGCPTIDENPAIHVSTPETPKIDSGADSGESVSTPLLPGEIIWAGAFQEPQSPPRVTLGPVRQGDTHPSLAPWPEMPSIPCPDCGTLDAWEPTCAPRGWVCGCKTMHACPGAREAAWRLWRRFTNATDMPSDEKTIQHPAMILVNPV